MKKKLVEISEFHEKQINRLRSEAGYATAAEVLRHGVQCLYKKEFKDYLEPKRIASSAEEVDIQKKLCDQLGGTILNDECTWTSYTWMNPHKVSETQNKVPLDMLKERHLERQYEPSKEKVDEVLNKPS